jgi:hypothetical protein
VRLAQHMSVGVGSCVRSTVIEANEFPELSRAYQRDGRAKVVINDRVAFEGELPSPSSWARSSQRGGLLEALSSCSRSLSPPALVSGAPRSADRDKPFAA